MQAEPQMNKDGSPHPSRMDESKHYYEKRFGVKSTVQGSVPFRDSEEMGQLRTLASFHDMGYSPIEGRSPTAPERGHAPDQNQMGRMNNSFERND